MALKNAFENLATESKQIDTITAIDTLNTNLGAKADTSATSDSGTFSLIALIKRIAGTLTSIKTKTDNIPTSPSQDRTTAASPSATRLSDGTSFYKPTTPSDTQPVSAASLPLPSGAATSAKQDTGNISLSNVDANLGAKADTAATSDTGTFSLIALIKRLLSKDFATSAKQLPDDHNVTVSNQITQPTTPTDTQPVSAASLPLPSGAATSANQLPDGHNVTVANQITQPTTPADTQPTINKYQVADIDKGGTTPLINYYGFLDQAGNWYIMKENLTSATAPSYRFAALSNNTDITGGYSGAGADKAWANRATLTYGYLNEVTLP